MLDESISHSINLSGWERVRTLEGNEKHHSGMFPSRATVQNCQNDLEAECEEIFHPKISEDYTVVTLDPKSVLDQILENAKGFGRTREQIDAGNLPVPIDLDGMIDGAKATEHKGTPYYLLIY